MITPADAGERETLNSYDRKIVLQQFKAFPGEGLPDCQIHHGKPQRTAPKKPFRMIMLRVCCLSGNKPKKPRNSWRMQGLSVVVCPPQGRVRARDLGSWEAPVRGLSHFFTPTSQNRGQARTPSTKDLSDSDPSPLLLEEFECENCYAPQTPGRLACNRAVADGAVLDASFSASVTLE